MPTETTNDTAALALAPVFTCQYPGDWTYLEILYISKKFESCLLILKNKAPFSESHCMHAHTHPSNQSFYCTLSLFSSNAFSPHTPSHPAVSCPINLHTEASVQSCEGGQKVEEERERGGKTGGKRGELAG